MSHPIPTQEYEPSANDKSWRRHESKEGKKKEMAEKMGKHHVTAKVSKPKFKLGDSDAFKEIQRRHPSK
jgi:hypothetical protein